MGHCLLHSTGKSLNRERVTLQRHESCPVWDRCQRPSYPDLVQIRRDRQVEVRNATQGRTFTASHALSKRQIEVLFAGGLIRWVRARL